MSAKKVTPKKGKPGPRPERLKIEGGWEQAVKQALERGRPPGGSKPAKKDDGPDA